MKQALTIIFAVLFLSSALPAADIIGQWIFNADKPLSKNIRRNIKTSEAAVCQGGNNRVNDIAPGKGC